MLLQEYLSSLFEQEPLGINKAKELNPQLYSILKGIKVDLPTFNSFKTIVTMFQNNLKRCEKIGDIDGKLCGYNEKVNLYRKEIMILGRAERICRVQRDSTNCREKVRNKIDQFTEQIKKGQQQIVNIKKEIMLKKTKQEQDRRKQIQNVGKNISRDVSVER